MTEVIVSTKVSQSVRKQYSTTVLDSAKKKRFWWSVLGIWLVWKKFLIILTHQKTKSESEKIIMNFVRLAIFLKQTTTIIIFPFSNETPPLQYFLADTRNQPGILTTLHWPDQGTKISSSNFHFLWSISYFFSFIFYYSRELFMSLATGQVTLDDYKCVILLWKLNRAKTSH